MKASQSQSLHGRLPMHALTDKSRATDMKLLMDIIRAVRNIRAEVNTPMSKKVPLVYFGER